MAAQYPNVYSTSFLLNVSSTAATTIDFGFTARFVRIDNMGAVDLYLDPRGNAPSTAAGFLISSCSDHRVFEYYDFGGMKSVPWGQLGLTTTSTSAGGQAVRVIAIG